MMGGMNGNSRRGFTIVELLIVIVVIAVMATIIIISFTGIQQRAKNNAKISTVKQVVNLIRLYKAENEDYPRSGGGTWCLTQDNACTGYSGTVSGTNNTALMNDLKRYGMPPADAGDTIVTDGRYGIQYLYASNRTLSSQPNPVLILFWLEGLNQNCSGLIGGAVSVADSGTPNDFTPAPRSSGNSGGKTRCYIMFAN